MINGVIPKTKAEALAFYSSATEQSLGGALAAGSGVSVEANQVAYTKTVLRFDNAAVALVDAAGVVAYKGTKILDLPAGLIDVAGVVVDLALTKSSAGVIATWDGDVSVGTVTAAGDATLTGTEANLVASTATPQAVAGATTAKAVSTDAVLLDGTAAAVDVYLNLLVDDADHDVTTTPCNLILNGTVTVTWANLGDK